MWDLIKNDPILKAIFVIVLGIFSFSFAFSIMFGAGQGGMEHSVNSGGYNLAAGLGQIVLLLSKVLIIIFLIAIIIAAVKFIQRHIIANEPVKGFENLKSKPVASVLVGIGGILLLLVVLKMILPVNNGNEMMRYGSSYGYNNNSFGVNGLFVFILRIFTFISVIGLVTGVVMYFKNQYFGDVKKVSAVSKVTCSKCGLQLRSEWKCCPSCGAEKDNEEEIKIQTETNEEK